MAGAGMRRKAFWLDGTDRYNNLQLGGSGYWSCERLEAMVATLADRITIDPEQCGGRPCVRGMRIRVSDVLDLLANGLSPEQVAEELPDLEPADIQVCLRFASRGVANPEPVARSFG